MFRLVGRALREASIRLARIRFAALHSLVLPMRFRPNYSFKRTAATGCGTIMRYAAAAA